MTTANKVTIFRILLIPFFVGEVLYYRGTGNEIHLALAILSFALASICDGVDGYIARHYNQRSELGAILDPLADKLLLVSAVVVLSLNNPPFLDRMPLWLTVTIIGRDVVLLLGLGVIQMTVGKVKVRPRVLGKIATVLQMAVVLCILLESQVVEFLSRLLPAEAKAESCQQILFSWLSYGAAVCTGFSGLLYVWDGSRQLSAHPASSPASGSVERKV
jgi:cardiolipin synthase (CMP-forming)